MLLWTLMLGAVFGKNVAYQELLKEKYSHCQSTKKIHYLTASQVKNIEEKANQKLHSKIVVTYQMGCAGNSEKIVYVDSHIVRSLNETVVVAMQGDQMTDYEVASFMEPSEYRPKKKWLEKLFPKSVEKKEELYATIDGISSATLTAKATVKAVNRIKAIHQELHLK